MMRTFNVGLASICLVVVMLFSGGVHLLHGFQVRRQADALRVASERAEEEKNFSEAVRHLETYVSLVPSDRKAQLRLGLLYADNLNALPAVKNLEEVLRTSDGSLPQEDLHKARRKLVDMAMLVGRKADAEAHLAMLMKETPNDPELLDLDGQILICIGKDDEACKQFRKAIAKAPTQINSYVHLADILRARLDKKTDAEKVMHDMVSNPLNARSVAALQKYAYYLREQDRFDEALVQAERILKLASENSVGLWIAGCCYLAKGQSKTGEEAKALYKTAENFLIRGIKADKSDRAMYMVMAEVKLYLGRRDEAIAVLRQGMEATEGTGGYGEIVYDLGNVYLSNGQFAEAEKCIKELREVRLPPLDQPFPWQLVGFLDAKRALMKGQWKVAMETLVDILPRLRDAPGTQKLAYVYLGQCYHQQGDVEREIIAYSEAAKIDPYLYSARQGLAEIFLSRRNLAEAAEQYRAVLKGPHPEAEAVLSLARIWIRMRLLEDKEKRDWEPVDKLLDQIQRQGPLTPNLAVLRAEVLLAKDRGQEAEAFLRHCAAKAPQNLQIRLALINLAMYQADKETVPGEKEKKWKQASDDIDQVEQKLGDSLIVREKRGSCAVRRNDPQAIAVLKRLGENLGKMTDSEKTHLWGSLAALSVQANDLDLARSYCRLAADAEPTNIRIRYLLCDLTLRAYEKGKAPDLKELDRLLDEIERLGGRGPFWLYGKAIRTLVQSKKKDPQLLLEARGCLQEALEVRKDWSAPAVLAGKICEMQDEPEQALDFYLRAINGMGERDSDVVRRTVQLLLPRRRIEEARQLFDFLERQKTPLQGDLNQEYAYVKVFTGDIAEAEKDVEKSVPAGSKNYQDFLRQAQMYGHLAERLHFKAQNAGHDRRAELEMFRMAQRAMDALLEARSLNPQADEVWIALVQLLVNAGKPGSAPPMIAAAEASLKGEQAPVTLAKCLELLNRPDEAQAKYEAAAKASPQNSRILRQVAAFYLRSNKFQQAEPLLRQIVALQTPATLTDACWARRGLADILKGRGDFDHLCQGLALIDENLRSKAVSIDDKREKVRFLVADPRKEKIGEAIQATEDLVKGTDATPDDYFALAKLYLKKGDWNSYKDRMHGVLGAQQGVVQPAHLVFYIHTLLEKKELDDAENWLQTLERTVPNLFDTVRLRAECRFLRGDYKAAGEGPMAFLDNPLAQPQDRGQQLLLVAKVMESFSDRLKAEGKQVVAGGFVDKADTLFASLRSRRISQEGDIVFAAYLARQKRIRECLDVLEQCWDKCRAENLTLPANFLIVSKAADPVQYRQLEKILVAAADKSNRPVPLLLVLAALHARQRQYDKAIADYREILAKEPRNYKAMNNLALDLARAGQGPDEALKLIDDALAISGPMAVVLDSRAIIHITRQEPEKALEDLAAAISDEGAAEQYFHQAWAYSLSGKKTEASAAFAQAVKKGLDPQDLDPREISVYDRLKDGL
jgi:tetratricopeptide (TPR) repeat protein